jgi:hypothetical protein
MSIDSKSLGKSLQWSEWVEGYELGTGVSSFDGSPRGKSVASTEMITAGGGAMTPIIKMATSQESLIETLGVSTTVSASYGLASASAKMDFARSFSSSKFSSWVVIRAGVTLPYTEFANPSLTDGARNVLAGPGGALEFVQTYGDVFVTGVEKAAELVGVMQIDSSSEVSKEAIDTSLKMDYLSTDAGVQISHAIDSNRGTSSKQFSLLVLGSDSPYLPTMEIDAFIDFARKFPQTVTLDQAATTRVFLQDYQALGVRYSSPAYERARTYLQTINRYIANLRSASATIAGILAYPERYRGSLTALTDTYRPLSIASEDKIARLQGDAADFNAAFVRQAAPAIPEPPADPTPTIPPPEESHDPAYTIVSALASPPLVITYDRHNTPPQLLLREYNANDPSQRWIFKDTGSDTFQLLAGDTKMAISGSPSPNRVLRLSRGGADDAAGSWFVPTLDQPQPGTVGSADASGGAFEVADGQAVSGTRVCLAARGDTARQLWSFVPVGTPPPPTGPMGIVFGPASDPGFGTSAPPAIVAFNGLFHIFHKDRKGDAIYHVTSPDGEHWTWAGSIGQDTSTTPCPVVFGGQLHLFFRDSTGNAIFHVASSDGASFAPVGPGNVGHGGYFGLESVDGPVAAAVLNDTLCLVAQIDKSVRPVVGKLKP